MSVPPARPPARPVVPNNAKEERARKKEKTRTPSSPLFPSIAGDTRPPGEGRDSRSHAVGAAPAAQAAASSQDAHSRTFVQRCPASSVACWCCHLPFAAAVLSCSVDACAQCRPPAVSRPAAASRAAVMEPPLLPLLFILVAGRLAQAKAGSVGVRKGLGAAGLAARADVGAQDWGLFVAPSVRGATARGDGAQNKFSKRPEARILLVSLTWTV